MDNSTMPTHVCYFTQISNALFGCIIEEKAYNKKSKKRGLFFSCGQRLYTKESTSL